MQETYLEAAQRWADYQRQPDLSPYLWLRFLTMQRLLILHRRHLQTRSRDAVRVPERLGEFRLLREAGRGGMGVVYEAEQSSLGRRVALKVLAGSISADRTALERFQREAAAAAQLHHTNIVPVFGMGECDGVHFYAMQYIAGKTLRELQRERESAAKDLTQSTRLQAGSTARSPAISRTPWEGVRQDPTVDFSVAAGADSPTGPFVDAGLRVTEIAAPGPVLPDGGEFFRCVARIGRQVAEALAYANEQGILHRDIKPSNLMLDTAGNVWITDFGLAKQAGSEDLTAHGSVIGTLRYLSPERLHGVSEMFMTTSNPSCSSRRQERTAPPVQASAPTAGFSRCGTTSVTSSARWRSWSGI
ncbi:MAG: protein kinase [Planctomycetaceae bacterium]|nr:protein kinase [Planctomycetaceae bacterium]